MRTWAEQDPRRAGYARDVAAIYRAYAAALDRLGRVDRELLHLAGARRAARRARAVGHRAGVLLRVRRPASRSSATRSRRSPGWSGVEVTVSLTYEAGKAGAVRAGRGRRGAPAARRARAASCPRRTITTRPARGRSCTTWNAGLFEPEPHPPGVGAARAGPGGRAARGGRGAGRGRARRRRGARPAARRRPGEEIAIVYRSPEPSAPLIERVFDRYGIPVAASAVRAAARHGARPGAARAGALRAARPGTGDAQRTCSSTCARRA